MKLSPKALDQILSLIKVDERVILGPKVGEDFAVLKIGNEYLVVHSDPITGASRYIGWYSVVVPSNDVATSGATPKWLLPVILSNTEEKAKETLKEIIGYSKKFDISIIGGHTEVTPGINRTIVSSTAMGVANKIITSSGAKRGDVVYISKGAGIEGTAIIALDFEELCKKKGIPEDIILRAQEYLWEISVIKEAKVASKYATSMHDATEGGVLGALLEVSMASNHRIIVDKIPVREETRILCEALGLDPKKLISSGTLIITIPKEFEEDFLTDAEKNNIEVYRIGEVGERGVGVLLREKKELITNYLGEELDKLYS